MLSGLDPGAQLRFRSGLRAASQAVSEGVSSGRATACVGHWTKWLAHCDDLGLDPFLKTFSNKIPILQVFIQQVCTGELAANGNKIRARSAEDYLRSVAQAFLAMGAADPRLNSALKTDFRISRMLAAWKRKDPPANRVKPIPIAVIRRIAHVAQRLPPEAHFLRAFADMIIIAFFFLLRPG